MELENLVTGITANSAARTIILHGAVSFAFSSYRSPQPCTGTLMTDKQLSLSASLKRLGFTKGNQMKLYGEVFEVVSEPIIMADNMVLVDATERKSGQARRVRIPLPIVHMASREDKAA